MNYSKQPSIDIASKSGTGKNKHPEVPHYFTVSTRRVVVLGILTFGGYGIYWSYKNWKAIEDLPSREGAKKPRNHPVLSSIFFPLTSYELFSNVRESQKALKEGGPLISAGRYAWLVFLLNLVGLSFIPVSTSQKYMNNLKLKAFGRKDVRQGTSWGEIVVVIIVALLAWGRVAESASSNTNSANTYSPQIIEKKSQVDSLTTQYNQCSSKLNAQRATVDLTSQSAVDAYNAQLQACEDIRIQQNKAVDEYNTLISE